MEQHFQKKFNHLKELCSQKGLRLTHQRTEVLRELASAKDHPSAETLYSRVKGRVPAISLDTVYRTLGTFMDLGLAAKVPVDGDLGRFDGDVSPHHHVVCVCCGAIRDFIWDEVSCGELPAEVTDWCHVTDTQVIVRGICRDCKGSDS
ncbi:MAG: transcriptional repressor [Desulfovibrio sp.]|nr:MAG: transcriptional repressor [Desulfovibrio sp.]